MRRRFGTLALLIRLSLSPSPNCAISPALATELEEFKAKLGEIF
jgi:hypothetical protein